MMSENEKSVYQELLLTALAAHNAMRQNLRSPTSMQALTDVVDGFAPSFKVVATTIDRRRRGDSVPNYDDIIRDSVRLLWAQHNLLDATLQRLEANDQAVIQGIVVQPGPSIELAKRLKQADELLSVRAGEIIGQAEADARAASGGEKDLKREFDRLAAEWKSVTQTESFPTRMAEQPSYRKIVALGDKAVPLILQSLAREPDHWFIALNEITGEDPVTDSERGYVDKMAAAWLAWGRRKGFV
jgi:hypothetical protein